MVKVLVTGGTGLLGWWVAKELAARGYTVYATFRSKQPPNVENVTWIYLNLEEHDETAQTLTKVRPDVVIHCAAYTDVDGCELNKALAYRVNVEGTRIIAKYCQKYCTYLIYVSTDYVFDGEKGLYTEEDVPCPVNYYGLTKLLGEEVVKSVNMDYCIVRVSGLYGYSPTGKKNFGIIALEKLMRNEIVIAFQDQYLSPTYVKALAKSLAKLIELHYVGTLHIAGERFSRYQFAIKLAELLGASKDLVRPGSLAQAKLLAKRPRDSSLNTKKAHLLGVGLPPMEECLKDFIETYRRHGL